MNVADRTLAVPQRIIRQDDGSLELFGSFDGIVTFPVAEIGSQGPKLRQHGLQGCGSRSFRVRLTKIWYAVSL